MAAAWPSFPGTADFFVSNYLRDCSYLDLFRYLQARVWVDTLKPVPIVSEKVQGDHKHHELGHCMGQWFPVRPASWRTRGSSWSPAGLCPSHSPGQGGGQAGCGREGQTEIPVVKAHSDETDQRSWQEIIPWVRSGSWDQLKCMAWHGHYCNAIHHGVNEAQFQRVALSEASSSSSILPSFSATVWTILDTRTISIHRQLNSGSVGDVNGMLLPYHW